MGTSVARRDKRRSAGSATGKKSDSPFSRQCFGLLCFDSKETQLCESLFIQGLTELPHASQIASFIARLQHKKVRQHQPLPST